MIGLNGDISSETVSESKKSLFFSLLTRNLAAETGSTATASATTHSCATRDFLKPREWPAFGSGALDELSRLRILIAHGGGFAPYQIGRFGCAHRNRSSVSINTKTSPRDLLRRFYFDALTHDPKSLRLLIDQVGPNHIAIGTDNPFDMGYQGPLGELDKVQNLTSDERECICCRTAESLLGEG